LFFIFIKRPILAALNFILPVSIFISQFVFFKKIFDPFFKKKTGYNVYGTLEPEGEVKQQIVVCGHHDAAYVFHYMEMSPKVYLLISAVGVLPLFPAIVSAILLLIRGKIPSWLHKVILSGVAVAFPMWWFTTDEVSPAAGDNMIASSIVNEVTKIFSDLKKISKNPLKHTRILCLSTDGEECGLRGAFDFVKKNEKKMKDIKTYVFCIDGIYKHDKLVFFDNDLNLTTDLSREMAEECLGIAKSLGYKGKISKMPWGGGSTDAAAFAKKGIEATNLTALEMDITKLEDDLVYHTSKDCTEAIEPYAVEQTLNVAVKYILEKDKQVSV
jgi:hypothetical protein